MPRRWTLVALASLLSACSTLPDRTRWADAATSAARDPGVWVPLAGSAALSVGSLDEDLSRWARERTPLFGSMASAERASDDLLRLSNVAHYTTALLTPGAEAKLRAVSVGVAATLMTRTTTDALKSATGRMRPDGSDDESFPSGHAAGAGRAAASAAYNLEGLEWAPAAERGLRLGLDVASYATGWARVEAGKHYATDALVGAALGRFTALFLHRAFLGDQPGAATIAVWPGPDGPGVYLSVPF